MEVKPVDNTNTLAPITPAPISEVENNFRKQELSLLDTDIKAKSDKQMYDLTQNVKDYTHIQNTPSPFGSLVDNKIKFNDFNIDVNDAYKKLNSGEMIPMYDNFIKGTNNEERFAQGQSTLSKWGNGLTKLLGKTTTAVLGGTIGSVNGILDWAKTGSFQATYDNKFNDWLDDLNTKMDYKLPNYYNQQEKTNSFVGNLNSANFWANDVLGGLSFTAGTIISEGLWAWATGGASLGTTAARVGADAARLSKSVFSVGRLTGEVAETAEAMNKVNRTVKAVLTNGEEFATKGLPTKLATRFGQAGELANTARFTYTSAGFEAGQEARNYMRDARQNFNSDFEQKNGRKPSSEDYQKFEQDLTKSANSLFAFNMALVGSDNLAVFGKMLNIKSPLHAPTKWANETLFGIGAKKAVSGEIEAISANRLQNILGKTYAVAKVPIIEGLWEEGLQSAGQNTSKGWIQSTYDPKYMGNSIGLGLAMTEGIAQTYGGKEGWKEIGVGMIVGLLSGTGISVAQGHGLFGELNEAKESNSNEIKLRNEYTAEKLLDRIHTANRVSAFSEEADKADERGDITGSELSRASAMIAHITSAYNFGYTQDALKDVKTGINSMDDATLMKQYDLETSDEVRTIKDTLYSEYENLTKEYKKQRTFVDYMINDSAKEFKNPGAVNQIKEAVAYELTLGSKAYNFSGELLQNIQDTLAKNYNTKGQEISTALSVQDILWSASKEIRQDFNTKQKELKDTKQTRDNLEKERLSLEKSKNSKEDNTADLNRLNSITVELEKVETEIESKQRELEGVVSAAQLQNPYSNKDQVFVTADELENVNQNLNSISKMVEDFKNSNPREGYRLEGILKEYQKSKSAFTRYADLSRQISDPKLGLRGKRNIISELMSDKSPSQITLDFVKGMSESMSKIKDERATEAIESTSKFQSTKRDSMQRPVIQKSVSTVQDVIENNPYLMENVGTADNVKKPTAEQIEEYKDLVKKVKSSKTINNNIATGESPFYYSFNNRNIKMSPKELQRFQDLNKLMSDWRFYQGALNSEGISIADLVEQEVSREQEVLPNTVQEDLTIDDYVLVSTPTETIPGNTSQFRNSSVVQTYENVKVQVMDGFYYFSHLNISSLVAKIKGNLKVVMKEPKTFDENGYVTAWNRPIEASVEDLFNNQKKYGYSFILKTDLGEMPITVINQGRLQIPVTSFSKMKESLGLDIFKQLATRTSYSDLYEANENEEYSQKDSDFKLEQELGAEFMEYTPDEVMELVPGTNTFFKLNMKDSYNDELIEKFRNEEITFDTVMNQVKIYNVAANGKVLGDLKSNQDITDGTDNFMEIRRISAETLLQKTPGQDLITIPYTAKVKYVLIGVPSITMVKTEDGMIPKSIEFTDKALEQVMDYGYMENGSLKLKGSTTGVRMDFVSKLSKKSKVPVIIFKQGQYNVAYPVTLNKTTLDESKDIVAALSSNLNNSEKATVINNVLARNGMRPTFFYNTEEDQNLLLDNQPSPSLMNTISVLSQKEKAPDVEQWIKPTYKKENLKSEANITVDLENRVLKSPKIIIDFDNAENNEQGTPWYDNYVVTGEISDEKISEIASKAIEAGLNLNIQGNYINTLERLNKEAVALKTERKTASEGRLESINTELAEKYKQIESINANPSLASISKSNVFSSQELDVYNSEKQRIKNSINEIVKLETEKAKQAAQIQRKEC